MEARVAIASGAPTLDYGRSPKPRRVNWFLPVVYTVFYSAILIASVWLLIVTAIYALDARSIGAMEIVLPGLLGFFGTTGSLTILRNEWREYRRPS